MSERILTKKDLSKVLNRYVWARQSPFNYETMQSGGWVWAIHPAMAKIYDNDKEVKLTTLEFDLLLLFLTNKNKSFSRDEILNSVWGDDYFGSDRVVDDLVRRLRRKMDKLNISTVYGYGYRLS